MLPLSPLELEKADAGNLDAAALVSPSADDPNLAPVGSGGGYGTSGDKLDSTSLALLLLLRRKSYATFSPAERTRLLRGLCDLAGSTGPIKEHLQASANGCGQVQGYGGVTGREGGGLRWFKKKQKKSKKKSLSRLYIELVYRVVVRGTRVRWHCCIIYETRSPGDKEGRHARFFLLLIYSKEHDTARKKRILYACLDLLSVVTATLLSPYGRGMCWEVV